jgi:hypothetical protein
LGRVFGALAANHEGAKDAKVLEGFYSDRLRRVRLFYQAFYAVLEEGDVEIHQEADVIP